jgi:hypothetical protein
MSGTRFASVGKIARRRTEEERAEAFFPPRVTTTAADHSARTSKPETSPRSERGASMFAPPICRRR